MNYRKEILSQIYLYMSDVNNMAPFPIYDTGDMADLKKMIDTIEYDEEPVECCANCKSLHLIEEEGKTHCMKCRTTDPEIEEFKNIKDYLSQYGDIWDLKDEKDE